MIAAMRVNAHFSTLPSLLNPLFLLALPKILRRDRDAYGTAMHPEFAVARTMRHPVFGFEFYTGWARSGHRTRPRPMPVSDPHPPHALPLLASRPIPLPSAKYRPAC